MLIGAIIVAHNGLAEGLLDAARMIFGEVDGIVAVGVKPGDQPEELADEMRRALRNVDPMGQGALVLTDLFGGTPTNIGIGLLEPGKVEVITGVNLPMLVKFIGNRATQDLDELSKMLAAEGRRSILLASDVLYGRGTP